MRQFVRRSEGDWGEACEGRLGEHRREEKDREKGQDCDRKWNGAGLRCESLGGVSS